VEASDTLRTAWAGLWFRLPEEGGCAHLIAALGLIFIETDYSWQNPNEIERISITLVRAAAVRLAGCLKRHGITDDRLIQLLTRAELDPMPEVRFATASSEE
jgi:hypothetical protein